MLGTRKLIKIVYLTIGKTQIRRNNLVKLYLVEIT